MTGWSRLSWYSSGAWSFVVVCQDLGVGAFTRGFVLVVAHGSESRWYFGRGL